MPGSFHAQMGRSVGSFAVLALLSGDMTRSCRFVEGPGARYLPTVSARRERHNDSQLHCLPCRSRARASAWE